MSEVKDDLKREKVRIVAESTPQEKADTTSQMRISQEVIDELLRLGGCTRNSNMRIYEYYRRAKGSEETIPYLRREYQSDSVGITVDDISRTMLTSSKIALSQS